MRCPTCELTIMLDQPVDDPDAIVLRCKTCGGFWFGAGTLTSVLAVAVKGLKVLDTAEDTDLVCPECLKPLYRLTYPQTLVRVDMCGRCDGLWLDAGELKEIKMVRQHLAETGRLSIFAPGPGVKAALLRLIDATISSAFGDTADRPRPRR